QQGAYQRLLDYEWVEGPLPSQNPELARLLGVSPRRLAKIWPAIEKFFRPDPQDPTRLANSGLEATRQKLNEYRALQVEKGLSSARARSGSGSSRGSTRAQPRPKPK